MSENQILILYTVIWLVLFLLFLIKNRQVGLGGTLLLVYGISGIFGLVYYNAMSFVGYYHSIAPIRLDAMLYLVGCSLICIIPIIRHSKALMEIQVSEQVNISNLSSIMILFAPFLLYYFAVLLYGAISINPDSMASVYEIHNEDGKSVVEIPWFARRVQVFVGWTTYIWPILLFECLRNENLMKNRIWIPIIAILCTILSSYVLASRTVMLRELMYILIVFYFYKNTLREDVVKKIVRYSLIVLGVVAFFMGVITLSRYSEMDTSMTLFEWVSLYGGSGPVNFLQCIWDLTRQSDGDTCFSFVKFIFGSDTFLTNTERQEYYENYFGISTSIFYTVVGDIYQDFGRYLTPLFLILFAFLEDRILSNVARKKVIGLTDVLLLSLIALVVMFGVMYYVFKVFGSQSQLLANIILMIILSNVLKVSSAVR